MQKELLRRIISRYLHESVADNKQQQGTFLLSLEKMVCGEKAEVNKVIHPPQGFKVEPSNSYLVYLSYDELSYTNEGLPFYRLCLSNAVIKEFLQGKALVVQVEFLSILEAAVEILSRIRVYCNQNPGNEQANQLLLNHKECLTDWLYSLVLPNNSNQENTALSAADVENEIK